MGAVVLAYNLPDVVKLNLSGDVIADIYAGKITDWNDARLQELNPDVKLPAKKIILAYRSDGSGTTFVFTDYLSKVSESWKILSDQVKQWISLSDRLQKVIRV